MQRRKSCILLTVFDNCGAKPFSLHTFFQEAGDAGLVFGNQNLGYETSLMFGAFNYWVSTPAPERAALENERASLRMRWLRILVQRAYRVHHHGQ